MTQAISEIVDQENAAASGFLTIDNERYYAIFDVDRMAPFFITVVSSADHWLFVSSTGGLTAGRVSPETALFPYIPVDKIHDSGAHTGSKTLMHVSRGGVRHLWEPFNREHDGRFSSGRHLYKNVSGSKLRFEEVNHDLDLAFRYTWAMSDRYGFVRSCELANLGDTPVHVELLDGLQNILPAGAPSSAQTEASNLVDAYKWAELDQPTGLAVFALSSAISDRAEPCESLKANTAFCLGLDKPRILLSSEQAGRFRAGEEIIREDQKRGIRGAYLVNTTLDMAPQEVRQWQIVANIEQTQSSVVALRGDLADPPGVAEAVSASVAQNTEDLSQIIAAADGFQVSAEEHVTTHHYANVLFNVLRGGIFDDQYTVSCQDLAGSIRHFNRSAYARNRSLLEQLPEAMQLNELISVVRQNSDPQLERLCYEYLPITFGRRHGDPSRPWNQFAIRLMGSSGKRRLAYQGNWRDIFQNWEALTFSYPEFVESVIAKFVNASTADGYNPYRITNEGIDWEVEEPDDPWSYIGYWGDHQIIYLLKLLELSGRFHPTRLAELLRRPVFSYANVPYTIRQFGDLLANPKSTIDYDHARATTIDHCVAQVGADGKLVLDADGEVYTVTLLEKLLVPLLAKLGNLVVDGGIWLNTQRPEWNDANNALVGHGLSMVTLYYLRRYVRYLLQLLEKENEPFELTVEVAGWLDDTAATLAGIRPDLDTRPVDGGRRMEVLRELGEAAGRYRETVYSRQGFSGRTARQPAFILEMLHDACAAIDHSIAANRRGDGLYNAYNLMNLESDAVQVDSLYPMLEGQVAVLSSGAIAPDEACNLLEALFASDLYRPDQQSFMLYPDRDLPGFFDKNRIAPGAVEAIPFLCRMLEAGDERLVSRDAAGDYRFNADFRNAGDLQERLDTLVAEYGEEVEAARQQVLQLYESVFNHRAFTGRSGTMFGFEGLGCIYWHMVSKLLLAIQEIFFSALDDGTDQETCERLGRLYYQVRAGIGFNKSPAEYGAFPTDPYSHTPKHAGAQQPGMTGQVKEEILSRFGELGVHVHHGAVRFEPRLLRRLEFDRSPRDFRYLDVQGQWQEAKIPADALAFTWCQVPVIFRLVDDADVTGVVTWQDGNRQELSSRTLSPEISSELFARSGRVREIELHLQSEDLLEI